MTDFDVRIGDRRPDDAVAIIAEAERWRKEFSWEPRYDDLRQIVTHALNWEKKLVGRNRQ
ncbi:hypothetical protein JF546_04205 [Nitratireductor aquimarinus]|uniref:hypothetical protein n=1 Tax=Nitratireductor aquimarinus TaxID=889300 RepID=UPI001A8D7517|nr:hypothetical protein [Nitratireductor aquimarinus]MBN8242204.1 hypothetical protein [Nitratireductor aquimarinus]MBY6130590.1 hypothetical protein [Nitratireductor aquimarinus]MCA1302653.1 hypothetical protein [Nitratireductor aquimarinus]